MPDFGTLFSSIPQPVAVALMAMFPLAGVQVSVPVGIGAFHLPAWEAAVFSLTGSALAALLLLWLLPGAARLLSRIGFMRRFFAWLFSHTQKRFANTKARYGIMIGLILYIALPTPGSGVWTGSMIAFLFGLPFGRAFGIIMLGMIGATVVVTVPSAGIFSFVR